MGTISMIIGIISCIVAILGILGTILPELLSITAIGIYGVPVLSVLGIIFGIIIRIKNNSDAEQKKRGRTGLKKELNKKKENNESFSNLQSILVYSIF